MKIPSFGLAGLAFWLFGICPVLAADPGFSKLPPKRQAEFDAEYAAAQEAFRTRKIEDAFDRLAKAEEIFDGDSRTHNLRGSCHTQKKDFALAMDSFRKADALMPGQYWIEFNIAEMHFVQHQWPDAEKAFGALLVKPAGVKPELGRLIDFKLLVCHYKMGDAEKAALFAAKHGDEAGSPYAHYAQAVVEFEKKDAVTAGDFLAQAEVRHPDRADLAPWRDTLVESGYLKK